MGAVRRRACGIESMRGNLLRMGRVKGYPIGGYPTEMESELRTLSGHVPAEG